MIDRTLPNQRARRGWATMGCAVWLALGAWSGCDDGDEATDAGEEADAGSEDDGGSDAGSEDDGGNGGSDPLRITLDDGELQGDRVGGSRRFLKIPYAKPPLGDLRWKAPRPPEPWDGVRHETEFSESCAQQEDQGAPSSDNEDCLYLNVWAPDPPPEDAPVMMWIHGGGNFSGGAGIPIPGMNNTDTLWYDGQFFAADQGVVLVTLNYRLGPLGFMAHAELADEDEPVGNQGLHDQRMALTWIKHNIAKFGGDPHNVTIFGESAGSADVCYHVASPGSWDLFHRAISQSGGCTIRATGEEGTTQAVAPSMEKFGEALGCDGGEGQLGCMRDAPIEDILDNSMQPSPGAGETVGEGEWSFAAVIDGEGGFLPDAPQALFDAGEIADVPYLIGANHDEGTTFVWQADSLTSEEAYMAYLEDRYGDAAAEVFELYPPEAFDGDYDAARARVVGDAGVVCSSHDTARRAAKAGRTVYLYNFNYPWALAPELFLAGHAAEISHVFGAPLLPEPDPDSAELAREMNAYWARFAATGDPNGADAPRTWPEFSPEDDKRLQLDLDWEVLEDFRTEECAFWRKLAGAE